ncbi:MAG: xanthine dehydrogenase family protein subunit M [Proteobacteria bacterium]|nr:xanthine dehydrogenase family protein subunit M [Pseudomonadota bacterium]
MKAPTFRYHRPSSRTEALKLLSAMPSARILAGGQSLLPMLNFRVAFPDDVIDINRIADLAGIEATSDAIVIGAMTRQRALEKSPLIATHLPLMAEAIAQIGHYATRGRGTIGGSLCHLDPAAELPVVALAHDATLRIENAAGAREVAMADFPAGLLTPSLAEGEMLTAIEFPVWRPGHGSAFVEFARRHGDFAIVACGVLVELSPNGTIARIAIAIGGLAPTPFRLTAAEKLLTGRQPDTTALVEAARTTQEIDPLDDPQAPASYRRRLAPAIVRRALATALERCSLGAA